MSGMGRVPLLPWLIPEAMPSFTESEPGKVQKRFAAILCSRWEGGRRLNRGTAGFERSQTYPLLS